MINKYDFPNWLIKYNFSVYGNYITGDTLQEVLSNFCYYLNEIIETVNKYTDDVDELVKWVKGEGVVNAVNNKMEELIREGYFESLINQNLFVDLNSKIKEVSEEIEKLKQKDIELNNLIDNLNLEMEKINSKINEINDSILSIKNTINELTEDIEVVKVDLYDSIEFRATKKYLITPSNISDVLQQIVDDNNSEATYKSIVYIPPNNYSFNKTVERLNNIDIIFDKKCSLSVLSTCKLGAFTNGQLDKNDYSSGYSAGGNILIQNANFVTDSYAFGFGIGKNIKLINIKAKFKKGEHIGEIAGVDGFTIDKGIFIVTDTSPNYREEAEVIQIQTSTPSAFPFFGTNQTLPCKNVTFKRVTINGASTGIGSHGMVYGVWEEDFIFEKCSFNNCEIGIRPFGFYNIIINDCTFTNNKIDILSKGLIKNDDLNRPNGQASQNLQFNNLLFKGDRPDKEACIYIDNRRRTANEGGLSKSENITFSNLIFRTTGYACRLHNCKNVVFTNFTGVSDKGIRFSNTEIVSLSNINMEVKSDVHCIIFSKDSDYYDDGINKYVNIKCCNIKGLNKGIGVYDTFEGNIQCNDIQLTGSLNNKVAIEIGGRGKKFYVSNNSEYCHTSQSSPTFVASQYATDVFFDSNLSKGYTGSNNTSNNSTGTKGTFAPDYK